MPERRTPDAHRERGAVAVEFALILPMLVAIIFGTVEFGRAYNAQISLTSAAREGARTMAIQKDPAKAQAAVIAAAPSLNPQLTAAQVTVSPSTCTVGTNTTVTATYTVQSVSGLFGPGWTLTGKGVMRCGG